MIDLVVAVRRPDGSYAGQIVANGAIAWRCNHGHHWARMARRCARKFVR